MRKQGCCGAIVNLEAAVEGLQRLRIDAYAGTAKELGVYFESFDEMMRAAPSVSSGPHVRVAVEIYRAWSGRTCVKTTCSRDQFVRNFVKSADEKLCGELDRARWRLDPRAAAVMSWLKSNGVRLGACTTLGDEQALRLYNKSGLVRFLPFDWLVSGSLVEAELPSPALYLEALRRLEASCPYQLLFECSALGVAAAERIHLPVIAVGAQPGSSLRRSLERAHPLRVYDIFDREELFEVVASRFEIEQPQFVP